VGVHPRSILKLGLLFAGLLLAGGTSLVGHQADQKRVFRARTDFVSTTVVIRDARGNFVPDLRQDEFEVFEDGVRQAIASFSVTVGARVTTPAVEAPTGAASGLILPAARPRTDTSGRIFIIFIDDMHLKAADSPRVRALLGRVRDRLLHEGDLVAYVSTGYSSIESPLSYDPKFRRFNEAIGKVMGSAPTTQEIVTGAQTSQGPAGLRHNAHVAFSTAYALLNDLAPYNDRRKAFIYVSNGYDFNPFKDARFKAEQEKYDMPRRDEGQGGSDHPMRPFDNPFDRNGQQFSDADLTRELFELTRAARQANVTFYPIDPRGLIAGPDITDNLSATEWRVHVSTTVDSLIALGDETGGFCICNINNFDAGIDRIDNDMSDHYVIGYVSSNPDPMRVRRTIEIRVKRPGLRAIYLPVYRLDRSVR
jgi:VWFA-related protein